MSNIRKSKLAIFHFNPIELYPPVLNLLNYLPSYIDYYDKIKVFTFAPKKKIEKYIALESSIEILRVGRFSKMRLLRIVQYTRYYLLSILYLIIWRPPIVLYYESLSGLPVLFYKTFVNKKCRIFVHYHEYTSPQEYKNGMMLNNWIHKWEYKLYPKFEWISHTNKSRVEFFSADNASAGLSALFELPNYPPAKWNDLDRVRVYNDPILKVVYVGALSLETMYTREFTEWIIQQEGKVEWDIYSNNLSSGINEYFEQVNSRYIRLRGHLNYFDLPHILKQYQVGVILYRGHILNYVYNAPNKLFEYYNNGLDVWFPITMKGSLAYVQKNCYPKVIALDFNNLQQIKLEDLKNREGLKYKPSSYYCEKEYDKLINNIFGRREDHN